MLVWKSGMMTSDGIGDQLCNDSIFASCKSANNGRAGSGMIDSLLGARESDLKFQRIFSEIMQQACESCRLGKTDPLSELLRAISRRN